MGFVCDDIKFKQVMWRNQALYLHYLQIQVQILISTNMLPECLLSAVVFRPSCLFLCCSARLLQCVILRFRGGSNYAASKVLVGCFMSNLQFICIVWVLADAGGRLSGRETEMWERPVNSPSDHSVISSVTESKQSESFSQEVTQLSLCLLLTFTLFARTWPRTLADQRCCALTFSSQSLRSVCYSSPIRVLRLSRLNTQLSDSLSWYKSVFYFILFSQLYVCAVKPFIFLPGIFLLISVNFLFVWLLFLSKSCRFIMMCWTGHTLQD